ncbi:MAG TPA: alpha-glucuronidase family glycosyl hydrolase, partial [Chloroflexota bacterium]|nr:alpha-glucuronidase family glycosyl hydrolase [Chloroflexota bacterium]
MSEGEHVLGAHALVDLSNATVVTPPNRTRVETNAIAMLIDEVEKRSLLRWNQATTWPTEPGPVILVGTAQSLRSFRVATTDPPAATAAPEGYQLRVSDEAANSVVSIVGNDARGLLYGIGHLLRSLRLSHRRASLPSDLNVTTAPRYGLRGHQLGYRDKTNSYDGWDLRQWRQYVRDLAVFGANAIEIIPPRSDDRPTSVHFPLPPLETMTGV